MISLDGSRTKEGNVLQTDGVVFVGPCVFIFHSYFFSPCGVYHLFLPRIAGLQVFKAVKVIDAFISELQK